MVYLHTVPLMTNLQETCQRVAQASLAMPAVLVQAGKNSSLSSLAFLPQSSCFLILFLLGFMLMINFFSYFPILMMMILFQIGFWWWRWNNPEEHGLGTGWYWLFLMRKKKMMVFLNRILAQTSSWTNGLRPLATCPPRHHPCLCAQSSPLYRCMICGQLRSAQRQVCTWCRGWTWWWCGSRRG